MWFFYAFALVPLMVGAGLWVFNRNVVWWEWLAGCGLALMMALLFQLMVAGAMTADTETWSGHVTAVVHHPRWVEEYTVTVIDTHSDGNGGTYTTTRVETHERTHPEHWEALTTLGGQGIHRESFHDLAAKFGGQVDVTRPWKIGFIRGDRNLYTVADRAGYNQPITANFMWTNRVKAAPTLWDFPPVPEGVEVFDYPDRQSLFQSGRLVGTAAHHFSLLDFDRLNARIGPHSKANLILVGFGDRGPEWGQYQQAAWIGGKKNDLVVCYGGGENGQPATWAYVFGWTEKELVKANLQTLFLTHPINDDLMPAVEAEVTANYVIRDWSQFDYITLHPPTWSYIVFLLVSCIAQGGFWFWAHHNPETKDGRKPAERRHWSLGDFIVTTHPRR